MEGEGKERLVAQSRHERTPHDDEQAGSSEIRPYVIWLTRTAASCLVYEQSRSRAVAAIEVVPLVMMKYNEYNDRPYSCVRCPGV